MWPNRNREGGLTDQVLADNLAVSERDPVDGIAHGIHFTGQIKGAADLTVSGEITGSVFLPGHRVIVTNTGSINADVTCRIIEVEGTVCGDLKATDRVTIRKTSHVKGDIVSPQIELEEGCQFKGSVKMQKPDVDHVPPTKPKVVSGPGAVRIKPHKEEGAVRDPNLQTVLDL